MRDVDRAHIDRPIPPTRQSLYHPVLTMDARTGMLPRPHRERNGIMHELAFAVEFSRCRSLCPLATR